MAISSPSSTLTSSFQGMRIESKTRVTSPEEDNFDDAKYANDMRFKSTLEDIFKRYTENYTEEDDEIDLETGEIVVNNGRIASLPDVPRNGLWAELDDQEAASSSLLDLYGVDTDTSVVNGAGNETDDESEQSAPETPDDIVCTNKYRTYSGRYLVDSPIDVQVSDKLMQSHGDFVKGNEHLRVENHVKENARDNEIWNNIPHLDTLSSVENIRESLEQAIQALSKHLSILQKQHRDLDHKSPKATSASQTPEESPRYEIPETPFTIYSRCLESPASSSVQGLPANSPSSLKRKHEKVQQATSPSLARQISSTSQRYSTTSNGSPTKKLYRSPRSPLSNDDDDSPDELSNSGGSSRGGTVRQFQSNVQDRLKPHHPNPRGRRGFSAIDSPKRPTTTATRIIPITPHRIKFEPNFNLSITPSPSRTVAETPQGVSPMPRAKNPAPRTLGCTNTLNISSNASPKPLVSDRSTVPEYKPQTANSSPVTITTTPLNNERMIKDSFEFTVRAVTKFQTPSRSYKSPLLEKPRRLPVTAPIHKTVSFSVDTMDDSRDDDTEDDDSYENYDEADNTDHDDGDDEDEGEYQDEGKEGDEDEDEIAITPIRIGSARKPSPEKRYLTPRSMSRSSSLSTASRSSSLVTPTRKITALLGIESESNELSLVPDSV
ncbi:hypothetical protein M501DRAFT_1034449 [Patellaria atrata CBS 101060]|uniref:Uncharacterized protein n=1 Tax=Patellaria atrata CBS 101060 TaxID=1346257 RepID=A0A9P4S5G4_9PEZI|nr:hypothetical protein M501DRAFT_1034449 [Patellaria atrata CBS 101060]